MISVYIAEPHWGTEIKDIKAVDQVQAVDEVQRPVDFRSRWSAFSTVMRPSEFSPSVKQVKSHQFKSTRVKSS